MGTSWSLSTIGLPDDARDMVERELDLVIAQMSQWEPRSVLSGVNNMPIGEWCDVPREFGEVLGAALAISAESGGAFDPAIGRLTDLWGFGPPGPPDVQPSAGAFEAAWTQSGAEAIDFNRERLRVRRNLGATIDFSGIAKGYAVDRVAEALLASGIRHFLIEIGGELRGSGVKPDGQPWWVDLEAPPGVVVAPLRLALHGIAVATSGDYRRRLSQGEQDYSHSFNPRTGLPIENGVRSVTVLHPHCMMADGYATAITVLGADEGMVLARRLELAVRIIDGDGEHISPALAAMLD